MGILTFEEAMQRASMVSRQHLILGNGFSIALRPDIFTYGALLGSADFSVASHVEALFNKLGTNDFELVIQYLLNTAKVLDIYDPQSSELVRQLRSDADIVKEALVTAIAKRHPDRPYDISSEQYQACRAFLARFRHIYTLNYDALLYWALMNVDVDNLQIRSDDGFRHPEREESYVTWQEGQSATVHFLHGALHLFDNGSEILKYTWSKTEIPIVDQIRQALSENKFPLFVAEGDSDGKLAKIMHSAFLHKGMRSLQACADNSNTAFVVFGHSLAENDVHVLKCIGRGKAPLLLVSMHGEPDNEANKQIAEHANWLMGYRAEVNGRYPLQVEFYDAASAHVWG